MISPLASCSRVRLFLTMCIVAAIPGAVFAQKSPAPTARGLAEVRMEKLADAPGYSEGPTWRAGDVFFCSGPLLRIDASGKAHSYLDLGPAGTFLTADGRILVCDNKHKILAAVTPEGKVEVLADRAYHQPLRSLNDLTVDARGCIYWTDPEGSTPKNPVGRVFRMVPGGRIEEVAGGLAFPNGLDVDPAGENLYVIESQSKKILRYRIPKDDGRFAKPTDFYDLGGSGGDGCAFDEHGNLWVADFHRPESGKGRITVLTPKAEVIGHIAVPAKVVSNITFGGPNRDRIYCTTGEPPGVFTASVGVRGFAGHTPAVYRPLRTLDIPVRRPDPSAEQVRAWVKRLGAAATSDGKGNADEAAHLLAEIRRTTDPAVRGTLNDLMTEWERHAVRIARDRALIAEVKRLGGSVGLQVTAPMSLRSMLGDDSLAPFAVITELILNERTDGHKAPTPKALSDRVTDAWLEKWVKGRSSLRRLELSGTAVTSDGLIHLKDLKELEILNVCLTAVDDRGFEHLAGMTKMKRMVVCSSKITGSGFRHLSGMSSLESINLHSSPASDEGLSAIGKLTSLQRLEIVHTKVTDSGAAHLAGLTELRRLHVEAPGLSESAWPLLGKLSKLEQLDLYGKSASNASLKGIAEITSLRMLMIAGGTCDDAGTAHLSGLKNLEELVLNARGVTGKSIDTLARLTRLRTLDLRGTSLSAADLTELQKRLPETKIVR